MDYVATLSVPSLPSCLPLFLLQHCVSCVHRSPVLIYMSRGSVGMHEEAIMCPLRVWVKDNSNSDNSHFDQHHYNTESPPLRQRPTLSSIEQNFTWEW